MSAPARTNRDQALDHSQPEQAASAFSGLSLGNNVKTDPLQNELAELPSTDRPVAPEPEAPTRREPSIPNVDTFHQVQQAKTIEVHAASGTAVSVEREIALAEAGLSSATDIDAELERHAALLNRSSGRTILDRLVNFVSKLIKRLELRLMRLLKRSNKKQIIVKKPPSAGIAPAQVTLRQSRYQPMEHLVLFDDSDGNEDDDETESKKKVGG